MPATLWETIETVLSARSAGNENEPAARSVLLYGPPGTGKTYAATRNANNYVVTLTEETPMAELRGHYLPNETGAFVWHDGPAIRAWKEGARLVLNEIDRANPDVWSLLYAIADSAAFASLTLPTGETVRPASGFQVVATTNAEPDVLPDGLKDRFAIRILVREVNPNALKALSPDIARIAKETTLHPVDDSRRVSLRQWQAFDSLRASIGVEIASSAVFGNRAHAILDSFAIATAEDPDGFTNDDDVDVSEDGEDGEDRDTLFRDRADGLATPETVAPSCPTCKRRDRVIVGALTEGRAFCGRCEERFIPRPIRRTKVAR